MNLLTRVRDYAEGATTRFRGTLSQSVSQAHTLFFAKEESKAIRYVNRSRSLVWVVTVAVLLIVGIVSGVRRYFSGPSVKIEVAAINIDDLGNRALAIDDTFTFEITQEDLNAREIEVPMRFAFRNVGNSNYAVERLRFVIDSDVDIQPVGDARYFVDETGATVVFERNLGVLPATREWVTLEPVDVLHLRLFEVFVAAVVPSSDARPLYSEARFVSVLASKLDVPPRGITRERVDLRLEFYGSDDSTHVQHVSLEFPFQISTHYPYLDQGNEKIDCDVKTEEALSRSDKPTRTIVIDNFNGTSTVTYNEWDRGKARQIILLDGQPDHAFLDKDGDGLIDSSWLRSGDTALCGQLAEPSPLLPWSDEVVSEP